MPAESSGIACDSYNRYEEDFDLCVKCNNNSVRISIEWARIEPRPGEFDQNEINHYKKVLIAAKGRGLKTFVTLHHFSNPIWFSDMGAWKNMESPSIFARYVNRCVEEFHELIDAYIPINEPQVIALMSYTLGAWPPHIASYAQSLLVQINLIRAHSRAYRVIKKHGNCKVGLCQNIAWFYPAENSSNPIDNTSATVLNFMNKDLFILPLQKYTDFNGLNFYFTSRIKEGKRENLDDVQSDMGWWIYPRGLEQVLLSLKRFKKPIYITENGVADAMDKIRKAFIRDMLIATNNAMKQGVDVKGYFYWSLIDNYEWQKGFWPRFGLVEIDRENNLQRKPRPSFYYYSEICRNGKIEA
jgi:beta-glucosidase